MPNALAVVDLLRKRGVSDDTIIAALEQITADDNIVSEDEFEAAVNSTRHLVIYEP